MVDQRLLQAAFIDMRIRLDLEELHHIGIFDNLLIFRLWLCCLYLGGHRSLVLTGQ